MTPKYAKVEDEESRASSSDESQDALLGGENAEQFRSKRWLQTPAMNFTGVVLTIVLLAVSNFINAWAVRSHFASPPGTLTETSLFSPVHNWIKIPLVDKMIDNSPAPNISNPDHVYRLPPSQEVDDAWDRITDIPMFPISRDDILKIQKNPDISVLAPEHWGFGDDEDGNQQYFMEIDVFHQLHCLNAVRKGLVHNYHHYSGHKYGFVPPVNFERHMNHCIDILRQTLMCHADVEAVIFNWRETQIHPYPDFGVHRTCKDWDTLMEWTEKNKMPDMIDRFDKYTKPEGAVEIPAPPDMPKEGVDGVVKAPPGLGVPFLQPITGLAGVHYCLGGNETKR